MGAQASSPKPNIRIQVIGVGLHRTGTASFSAALSILLDAPVYHGGTQVFLGSPSHIKSWITTLSHWPAHSPSDSHIITTQLQNLLYGYAAIADLPSYALVPDLLKLYPDALIVCTVRDPDAWATSMMTLHNLVNRWYLSVVLFWIPGIRLVPKYLGLMGRHSVELYGTPLPTSRPQLQEYWEKHIQYVKRCVPEDRLLFYNVRDGWEPLCKVLGKEVPSEEFPRINDGKAFVALGQKFFIMGLMRWGMVVLTAGVGLAGVWYSKCL
ncbi:hypothetical protein E8E13_002351 [Curvularia kusanoi]|uniref:NAD dependent epimerase/dehydratase n=1 Tax=Curvularia kusanoi TaxID=90978 RepID=A0A9P4W3I8_CURKU|nr:hypothetical protein E8E13_002351 [Curvularia kusanoi]